MQHDEEVIEWESGELAALLTLLFRNMNAANDKYLSYEDQLKYSEDVCPGNTEYNDSWKAINAFYKISPGLFNDAHIAIMTLLETLRTADLGQDENGSQIKWSSCKFVSRQQILDVSRLR